MRFNVAQLLKEPVGSTRKYRLAEDVQDLGDEVKLTHPIEGALRLIHTTEGVLASGQFHTEVELTCSRCLESFSTAVDFTLEEEFHPTIDISTGAKLPSVDGEDDAILIDSQHIIDLREVMRQDILLAQPSRPLCKPDCAGLCSQCGQNLNEGPCTCEQSLDDPRWEALRALR
ncbi:MAG: DUF177 domain-containing protein [Anaerolineae bacterium]